MSDVGIRISRTGYDVSKAVDHQVVMDSDIFVLKIKKMGLASVPPASSVDSPETVVHHGFGFYPMWLFYDNFGAMVESPDLRMDKEKLVWGNESFSLSGTYILFDIDLEGEYNISNIKSGEITEDIEQNRKDDFVFAISSEGDIRKESKIEKHFTSELRYPLIHMIGNGQYYGTDEGVKRFNHNLGYTPQFFFYYMNNTSPPHDFRYQAIFGSAMDFWIYSDEETSQFDTGYSGRYGFVILKDPLGA